MTLLSAPYTYHLFLSLLSLDIYPTLFHMRAHTLTHVLHTQFKALETNFSENHALSSSRTVEFGDNILFFINIDIGKIHWLMGIFSQRKCTAISLGREWHYLILSS